MAKRKTTLTIDEEDLAKARQLTGSPTASATVAAALRALIRSQQLQRDLAAYGVCGSTVAEITLAESPSDYRDLDDDTDWASLYPADADG